MTSSFDIKTINAESKLSEVLRGNLNLLFVLNQFCIPLGFGEKTIKEVCVKHALNLEEFLTLLCFHSNPDEPDWDRLNNLSAACILNYLKKTHQYFLDYRLPNIGNQIGSALTDQITREPILTYFEEYKKEVRQHMNYENEVFFPYVETLMQHHNAPDFSVSDYEAKHDNIEEKLDDLINLLLKYLPTQGDSYQLRDVLEMLQQCNNELNLHRFLEDEVLVPKIRKMEKTPEKTSNKLEKETEELSDREKDIVCEVAKGLSNKEIADTLFLSIHTVITHRRNISRKLSIHSAAGLTVYAILNKLVDIEELRH